MVSAWLPSSVHNGVARLARVVGEEVESKLSRCNSESESEVGSKTFVSHHRPHRVQISFIIMRQTSQLDLYFFYFSISSTCSPSKSVDIITLFQAVNNIIGAQATSPSLNTHLPFRLQ